MPTMGDLSEVRTATRRVVAEAKAPVSITTTLYDLIAAIQTMVRPEHDDLVAPTRSLTALAQRLGVAEEPAPVADAPVAAPPMSLLLPTTGRNGASFAPKTLLNRRRVRAARKRITR